MSDVEELTRRCRVLEGLYSLARELARLEDYDDLLDAVMMHSLDILGAERGFLVLTRGEALNFKVVRGWKREDLESGAEQISRSILFEVLRRKQPLLVEDALSDSRFAMLESVLRLRIRSVLAAPLEVDRTLVGALLLEASSGDRLFGPPELELFTQVLELSTRALEACTRRLLLEQRNALLEADLLARPGFQGIVTRNPAFLRVLETVAQVAASDLPVLVLGPSGSGKELIGKALHWNSPRSKRPFLAINCGAISPALLESELFGHQRGAFTGAIADKAGLIPSANTGTVVLDEVGELPRELQVKLLRTLQFGEVQPVGSSRVQTVDVRFVAATNRDLERDIGEGRFREDLFYRLNTITVRLPSLKERRDDILLLFYHFLTAAADRAGRPVPDVSPRLERVLEEYDWPGNVRELENETKRLLALTPVGAPLSIDRLSHRVLAQVDPESLAQLSLSDRELVEMHLRVAGGNRTRAAKSLGLSREGLRKKMRRLGLH